MLLSTVADQQILAGTAATLSWQPVDSDGEPADPGTVTVGVTGSDGSEVIAAATATGGTGEAARTVALTAAQTAQIDLLTAVWKVGSTTVATTVHEIIGAYLLTRAEFVAREAKMSTVASSTFSRHRREVDDLFKRETKRGLTPRFAIERIRSYGGPRLILRFPDLRAVRWANQIDSDGTVTALTSQQIASIAASGEGFATLRDGTCWDCGDVEIGYEHGYDRAPFDVVGAAARYTRYVVGAGTSSVPDRATSFADGAGGVTQLATPGLGPFITGIPEVDEVLVAHRWNVPGIA
jgi:hypothetical protein